MERHLVTGGAGMIGSHLAERLLELGHDVTVVDDLSSGSMQNIHHLTSNPRFHFVKGDLRIPYTADIACRFKDVVYMLAADMGGMMTIANVHASLMHNNVMINANTLRACVIGQVPRVFYASSACVYNVSKQTRADVVPLKEEDAYPALPNESYGWEKLFTEQLCEAYQTDNKMNIRIARFHNVYGNGYTVFDKERGKAPCHLIMKAIKHPNPPFNIWGTGEATRSFIHFSDCIEMILRLMKSNYTKPINIGSDRLISINDLAQIIIGISGKNIFPTHDLTKPVGVMGRNADLRLARKVLGWEPKISLEDGLRETYDWAVKHYDELEGI